MAALPLGEQMSAAYAEECNYWKTSQSSPDSWLQKTIGLIESKGGELLQSAFGNEHQTGRAAYMMAFLLEGNQYKIVWPVLPSERGETLAAQRQAATMLYHDVKAKCVAMQALGARTAFFSWACLPDGRPMFQLDDQELLAEVPRLLIEDKT